MVIPKIKIIILVAIVAVAVAGTYGYFFFVSPSSGNDLTLIEKSSPVAEYSDTVSATAQVDQTQKAAEETYEYRNTARGFSLAFPQGLSLKEYDEGDGTYTIVFEDAAGEKGFQIFFTPYLGDGITQSRILKDVPSGKFTAPVEIVIAGGTHALAFFSTGPFGEMREVWFLHGGFLFEVTAPKEFDEWLASIMQTWRFFKN